MRTFRVRDRIWVDNRVWRRVGFRARVVWARARSRLVDRVEERDWPLHRDLLATLWEETRP